MRSPTNIFRARREGEPPATAPPAPPGPGAPADRPVAELERLAELKLSGALSQAEYDELTVRVLSL